MRMTVNPISKASDPLKKIAAQVEAAYNTGGKAKFFGLSPVDDALVLFYPGFTAVVTDADVTNVDEWDGMLDQIQNDRLGSWVQVGASLDEQIIAN